MKTSSTISHQASQTRDKIARSTEERASDFQDTLETVGTALGDYTKKHPTAVVVAVFFAGFYVGWKVKPW